MNDRAIQNADHRLTEAISHLSRARDVTRIRHLEGRFDERDLEMLMEADVAVEQAAADLRAAKGRF